MMDRTLGEIGEDLGRARDHAFVCPQCRKLRAEVARLKSELMDEKRSHAADQQRRAQRGM